MTGISTTGALEWRGKMMNLEGKPYGGNDTTKIERLKKEHQLRIQKLEKIAKDYVESILSDENEFDLDVLRYMLLDLLPLKEVREDVDLLINSAIQERGLPWCIEGDKCVRTGELVHKKSWVARERERQFLENVASIMERVLGRNTRVSLSKLGAALEDGGITGIDESMIEDLVEQVIRAHLFDGFIDGIEGFLVKTFPG
ncbi:hypothetical protein GF325_14655 [Candidatus Bathyarchaeota archaeon]|nr:hypothetical protein [Candidatus Bathyarchaeota archaeon]